MNRFKNKAMGAMVGVPLLILWGMNAAQAACDGEGSEVQITSSVENPIEDPVISLEGCAKPGEGITLSSVKWSLDGTDGTEGTTSAHTSDWVEFDWNTVPIGLSVGDNLVTVTAYDANNQEVAQASINVTYQEPPPPPEPDSMRTMVDHKSKLTIYGDDEGENDRFSINALIDIAGGDFYLPCDEDVTVTLSIEDPESIGDPDNPGELVQIWTDTVAAGAASTCGGKYRVVQSGPDIREVVIQEQTLTSAYVYVFAWKGHYLTAQRNDPAIPDFLAWVEDNIPAYYIEIQMGSRAWGGWSDNREEATWLKQAPCLPLDVAPYGDTKVELRCNR